jgi:late competence protein required for DNA uptake (superfamily II DNA/RNA helicase)
MKGRIVNIRLSHIGKLLKGKSVLVMEGLNIVCQEAVISIRAQNKPKHHKLGPRWVCRRCNTEYRVKTSFHALYCSACLGVLKYQKVGV